jgi:sugar O-acyltransferase (sialic acid O-acetyltransferase NeuD family)
VRYGRNKILKRILMVGGGGFSNEVAEIISINGFFVCGYVDIKECETSWPYWGNFEVISNRLNDFDSIAMGIGAVNREGLIRRSRIIQEIRLLGVPIQTLISPHAIVSQGVEIGEGSIISHAAVLSVNSKVGPFAILNIGSILGHDAILDSNVIMSPKSMVAGSSHVGDNCLLGSGAIILENKNIGSGTVIGAGSVVHRDVKVNSIVMPTVNKVLSV